METILSYFPPKRHDTNYSHGENKHHHLYLVSAYLYLYLWNSPVSTIACIHDSIIFLFWWDFFYPVTDFPIKHYGSSKKKWKKKRCVEECSLIFFGIWHLLEKRESRCSDFSFFLQKETKQKKNDRSDTHALDIYVLYAHILLYI